MLNFNPSWRFNSPGAIDPGVKEEFLVLIKRVAAQHPQRQHVVEHYKTYFADAGGRTSYRSTSLGWAESDLSDYMDSAAENAPLFIEALFDAGESLQRAHPQFVIPDPPSINLILAKHNTGYELQPPVLVSRNPQAPIVVADRVPSLDEQAQEIIQRSLKQSEDFLALGHHRQAVQEILWLLETVSTAFQGLKIGESTVQGKYFNKIADDLRRHHKGKTLEHALTWTTTLHGYLSSPTGGGVRHGSTLKADITMLPNEARLFCNLIRSYISFLLAEHDRLIGEQ
ncbi:MAG: hypothetical protein AB7S93_04305 [Xanthobacteraceae bacterium]